MDTLPHTLFFGKIIILFFAWPHKTTSLRAPTRNEGAFDDQECATCMLKVMNDEVGLKLWKYKLDFH